MIIRTALALSASGFALLPAAALAQGAISYETGQYEYAQPLPELDDDVVTETVDEVVVIEEPVGAARVIETRQAPVTPVFVSRPTIQPIDPSEPEYYTYTEEPEALPAARVIPARAHSADPATEAQPTYVYIRQPPQVIYVQQAPAAYAPVPGGASRVIYRPQPGAAQQVPYGYGYGYQGGYGAGPTYLPAGAQVVAFDRNAWLQECRSRLDTYESDSDRGEIIGGLLGGIAGGVLGNRIAGRGNRTAGTLIGAGAGAILGSVAGDAIEDSRRRRSDSYGQCEAYLDDYMQQATASAGTVQYSQPGQYMLVPVTVEVPQRAVYRSGRPVD